MAVLFKELPLDTITVALTPAGIRLDWLASNAEDLTKNFHIYRNTTNTFPDPEVDIAKVYASTYTDRPASDGSYYYWVAYINANGDHIVFAQSYSPIVWQHDQVFIPGRTVHTTDPNVTVPVSTLTTIDGSNGMYVQSTTKGTEYPNGLGTTQQQYYFAGDTNAGINSSANINMGGAGGTNTTPTQAVSGQMLGVINCNGYATNGAVGGWSSSIATQYSGGGTSAINTGQIGIQALENFACDATGQTVTNAGATFVVRLFPTATTMTVANRKNVITHGVNSAVYRSDYFQFRQGTTNTYSADFRSDTFYLKNNTGATVFATISNVSASFNVPVQNKVYTRTQAVAVTGSAGMIICISDSPTNNNRPAYWDGTTWRYISDNSAI